MREVICTSKDGDRFWRMPETYIRGNTIKYLRVPDEVIDKVKDEAFRRYGAFGECCGICIHPRKLASMLSSTVVRMYAPFRASTVSVVCLY